MKHGILNRWSGKVQFTAEINCAEDAPLGIKIGLSVKWARRTRAVLTDANLTGAVLTDADLTRAVLTRAVLTRAVLTRADLTDADLTRAVLTRAVLTRAVLTRAVLTRADLTDADLTRAVLTDANLTGAVLTDADLTGADLTRAVLTRAVLTRAVLTDANLTDAVLTGAEIPVIPNIDAAILASIEANEATGKNGLRMGGWHAARCDETNWCETTHCRAGYAICLAGAAGFALERKVGSAAAGALIYAASRPDKPVPDFYASDEDAMADIRACAAEQTAES
jgi:hypothetical protein